MTKGDIWVWGDLRTLRHWQESLKAMAKARPLALETGAALNMVLMGPSDPPESNLGDDQGLDLAACISLDEASQQALGHGVQTVYRLEHPLLAVPRTDVVALVLASFVQQRNPWLVLLPLNDFGRETAAICAQRCQAGLIADCSELAIEGDQIVGRCPAWGGQILADITLAPGWPTAFITMQTHGDTLLPEEAGQGRMEKIALDQVVVPKGLQLKQRALEPAEARRLEEAEMVVVGGAGLGDMAGFGRVRELAAVLGAEVGATRPPVMKHWVAEDRLTGQTGKTVPPNLLISAGTSGAIQYTAGIMEAETIVAINRDPAAPIFQLADVGMVADAHTLLPLLIQRAKKMAMRHLADVTCAIDTENGSPKGGFGALVRRLRQARKWTTEALAQATGQTPDFIAQVEADQLSPPVGFILRMAQSMQVDPGTFLNKEEQAAIRDRRAQAYYHRTQEYSYATLTPDAENSHLRAFMVTIEPLRAHKPVAYKHEGEEFIFVMEGDLEFTLGSKARVLKPGESIHFNSDVPHKLKSLSNEPTRCLVVLYTI